MLLKLNLHSFISTKFFTLALLLSLGLLTGCAGKIKDEDKAFIFELRDQTKTKPKPSFTKKPKLR